MKIKKFEGKNFSTVMAKVKKEFGKNAVIISTENLNGKVCLTAASDYEIAESSKKNTTTEIKTAKRINNPYAKQAVFSGNMQAPQEMMSLNELDKKLELDSLKHELHEQKAMQIKHEEYFLKELGMLRESLSTLLRKTVSKENSISLAFTPFLKAGIECGINENLLTGILDKIISDSTQEILLNDEEAKQVLKKQFINILKTQDIFKTIENKKGVFVFAGPTGVGKTTTLVKIAATMILEKDRNDFAITSIDFMRADSSIQLQKYSELLGIPFYHYKSITQYKKEIVKLKEKYPIILTDTAGISPLNKSSIQFLEKITKNDYTLPILHIPIATEYEQALTMFDTFKEVLQEMTVIFTKEDEAFRNGLIASLSIARNFTISSITNGQRIPEDIVKIKNAQTVSNYIFRKKL
jgi:flagellar biosynthesis protein FlhF